MIWVKDTLEFIELLQLFILHDIVDNTFLMTSKTKKENRRRRREKKKMKKPWNFEWLKKNVAFSFVGNDLFVQQSLVPAIKACFMQTLMLLSLAVACVCVFVEIACSA